MMKYLIVAISFALASTPAFAADAIKRAPAANLPVHPSQPVPLPIFKGRVAVIDGRTLWFPTYAQRVRLADIDACELPQWAFDPKWTNRDVTKAPPPVPCGPFAKAWLKRTIGASAVTCAVVGYDAEGMARARCVSRGLDIALEMLRVGWARVDSPYLSHTQYMGYQRAAMSARYGMWGAYVLDMNEWRRKAVDNTLDRQPIADFNLLVERKSEISPPFADAHTKPKRTDR
ncbi:thermonuclease family protein [Brucella sp. NBRC 113783]|uniref:thermonuclease family protein n=2 Tax=Brucella sp. NBRC 113783 TaxID=3075478 RepID=UPI0039B0E213